MLDKSVLDSDVVVKHTNLGTMSTTKVSTVNNCGFVWTTNTLAYTSLAWLDRSLVMESEFSTVVNATCCSKQMAGARRISDHR